MAVRNSEVLLWGYGGSPATSNNLMELQGGICGLEALFETGLYPGDAVELVSDSQYVLGMVTGAYHPTTNLEIVNKLRELAARIPGLVCRWVRGHQGEKWNEACDHLAGLGKQENTLPGLRKPKVTRGTVRRDRRAAALLLLRGKP